MSTFSPNLRLELITNGTQAGAWGTTTNTNLGTLIEGAVSGYIVVSVTSANQALTALYGSADQSRNAVIKLTTTTVAAFAVYAPPASKEYTIWNSTIYAATIYNATAVNGTTAAGTGVVIPAGKTMTVWSDATNFYSQNTHLISPTIATPTLDAPTMTGIPTAPTASTATNTTQVATTAFVQAIAALALNTLLPIGSIYTNAANATNPGTLLGFGTWVAFGAGRVPVGFDATNPLFDTAQETGGTADAVVATHTHTATTTLASTTHTHTGTTSTAADHEHPSGVRVEALTATYGTAYVAPIGDYLDHISGSTNNSTNTLGAGSHNHTITTGNNSVTPTASTVNTAAGVTGVNQNYQPYITVYMWRRTA
jgi:hypothetical protein